MSPLFLNLYLIICVNFGHAVKGINIWLLYNSVHVCAYVRLLYGLNLLKIQLNIMRFKKNQCTLCDVTETWKLKVLDRGRQCGSVCKSEDIANSVDWTQSFIQNIFCLNSDRVVIAISFSYSAISFSSVYNVQMFLSAWPWSVTLL